MKYTLSENAISSLSIAIEHFKKFYYLDEKYTTSEVDEAVKISLVFLENAIELMLKAILCREDQLAIYIEKDSKKIRDALARSNESMKLEDILIAEGNFKTITYAKAVEEYNSTYHRSKKVHDILLKLGEKRNAITHFGIDQTNDRDELIVLFINAFDVVYNYMYPQLKNLDGIGKYMTSDGIVVETAHGDKFLTDKDGLYNNILDFLDAMLEMSKDYVCSLRMRNPNSKMFEFAQIAQSLFEDQKFIKLVNGNKARIKFRTCDYAENYYYFDVVKDDETWDVIGSCYSPYFNVTAFCGETSNLYFLIEHNKHELFIYDDPGFWPSWDEPENDSQWICDCENGSCKNYSLSKRNLLLAFENLISMTEEA